MNARRLERGGWQQVGWMAVAAIYLLRWCVMAEAAGDASGAKPLSPAALASSPDGRRLYVAEATANRVAVFDVTTRTVGRTMDLGESPSGLALAADGRTAFVTCAAPSSFVAVIDVETAVVTGRIEVGHTALAPVLAPDGRTLFVCERFGNTVAFIDVGTRKVVRRVAVPREPVSAAVTPDGRRLFVANHLQAGRADVDGVASTVSVIDVAHGEVAKEITLPNGSGLLREIAVSPDGRLAAVVHQVSRFHLPTTQLERGWVNTSAVTLIDVARLDRINTVLVDNIDSGAANPWAVTWDGEGRTLVITHAGTHEISVIDVSGLLAKLGALPAVPDPGRPVDYTAASRSTADVPNDLSFLVGLRQRLRWDAGARGPRALARIGTTIWVAFYFGDSLGVVDLAARPWRTELVALGPRVEPDVVRRGEDLFNDASICFQGWQSCASCHSSDARVDGLNWDNLNDGIGNPKNAKSLLQAHATPPSMWLGVRTNAFVAVRAGIRNSLFTVRPAADAEALDEYLKSLKPMPSPRLIGGRPSPSAERGRKLFEDEKVGCADCHSGPYLTDLKFHNVGTAGRFDQGANRFDTPSLVEVWRTSPYLHDGRAASMREVLTIFNPEDQHGVTSGLRPEQVSDLVEYVLSL